MSVRQLVVLGTASQVPTKFRNHNGYLLLFDGRGMLFDPGEGTQRQMTKAGVRAHQIHRIGITHFHGDHCLGLPGILQRIHLDAVPHPVDVHYPASGQAYYDRLRLASIHTQTAEVTGRPHDAPGVVATDEAYTVSVQPLDHRCDAFGFRLEEPDSWTIDADEAAGRGVVGRAIGDLKTHGEVTVDGTVVRIDEVATPKPGQKVAFVMDTRPCLGAERLAKDVDLLICESTYLKTEQAEAHAHGHMTAADAGRLAASAGARRLVLTHFSQRYPMNAPFEAEAREHHDDVVCAEDLARIDVPSRSP